MKQAYDEYIGPFGTFYIVMNEWGVEKVFLMEADWLGYLGRKNGRQAGSIHRDPTFCREVIRELEEYFHGGRRRFTVPLAPEGTDFYQRVWKTLLSIPYGETRSYGEIAAATGNPKAQRAIGQANRKNPLPILIPCHRVIGKNGAMTGYLGDHLDIKRYLLEMEKTNLTEKDLNT
ncbi:MAG TPA: methylated-DNA--[protein]-cysteine S-methyltransferase [Bacillota bacterium]|nr:methylated-DNA--[protein]-cysteine S-methyltransferase [Bacillota bacterium]